MIVALVSAFLVLLWSVLLIPLVLAARTVGSASTTDVGDWSRSVAPALLVSSLVMIVTGIPILALLAFGIMLVVLEKGHSLTAGDPLKAPSSRRNI